MLEWVAQRPRSAVAAAKELVDTAAVHSDHSRPTASAGWSSRPCVVALEAEVVRRASRRDALHEEVACDVEEDAAASDAVAASASDDDPGGHYRAVDEASASAAHAYPSQQDAAAGR